jgi:hypothetical protein
MQAHVTSQPIMFKLVLRCLCTVALAGLSVLAQAQGLVLPEGLRFSSPTHLDLTYQVIPSYDDKQKVIASWAGERLQFFVAISRLPPGYTDAQAYHAGLARDLRAAWETFATGRQASYRAGDGLSGTVVEYIEKSTDPDRPSTSLFAHFLTDGQVSFLATATVVPPAQPGRVFDDTMSLMRTAGMASARVAPPQRSEDAFVGTWIIEERLPDGRMSSARIELKADLSFSTRVHLGEQVVLDATGVWRRSGHLLHWVYLSSVPPLPANRREDTDSVVASDRNIIIVRSSLSGKERTMRRAPSVAR